MEGHVRPASEKIILFMRSCQVLFLQAACCISVTYLWCVGARREKEEKLVWKEAFVYQRKREDGQWRHVEWRRLWVDYCLFEKAHLWLLVKWQDGHATCSRPHLLTPRFSSRRGRGRKTNGELARTHLETAVETGVMVVVLKSGVFGEVVGQW